MPLFNSFNSSPIQALLYRSLHFLWFLVLFAARFLLLLIGAAVFDWFYDRRYECNRIHGAPRRRESLLPPLRGPYYPQMPAPVLPPLAPASLICRWMGPHCCRPVEGWGPVLCRTGLLLSWIPVRDRARRREGFQADRRPGPH